MVDFENLVTSIAQEHITNIEAVLSCVFDENPCLSDKEKKDLAIEYTNDDFDADDCAVFDAVKYILYTCRNIKLSKCNDKTWLRLNTLAKNNNCTLTEPEQESVIKIGVASSKSCRLRGCNAC